MFSRISRRMDATNHPLNNQNPSASVAVDNEPAVTGEQNSEQSSSKTPNNGLDQVGFDDPPKKWKRKMDLQERGVDLCWGTNHLTAGH